MAANCPWGVGAKTKTVLYFEGSTYGELPATPVGHIMPINENTVKASQNSSDVATITGNRSPVEPIYGNNDLGGDITCPLDYVTTGFWLKACFDAPTTTAITGGYKHVFKIGAGMPSFTLEKQFPGITEYFKQNGCKVSKLSLSFGGDGELTATISILGKKETVSGTAISASPTSPDFVRALNFQAALTIGGQAVNIGKSFTLDIDFGLDADTYCIGGNGYRSAVCDGLVKISGSAELFFKDDTYIALAEASTETSVVLTLTRGTTEKLTIKLPEVKFARTGVDITGPTGVVQSLTYNAYYKDNVEQSAVVFELENQLADYDDD